jgi:hypothetical protein
MRTKTLLIAAATLAVGAASSMAQVTYSQNVVGYVNMTINAGKYEVVANTLINGSDVNQTNNNINAVLTSGFVSSPANNPNADPSISSNTVASIFSPISGFSTTLYYFNSADASVWENGGATSPVFPAGWYDILGNQSTAQLPQGSAVFVYNHFAGPITITVTGTVLQGTNAAASLGTGYNFMSLMQPISTNPAVALYGLPQNMLSTNYVSSGYGSPDQLHSDTIFEWSPISGFTAFYYFNASDATTWENGGATSPAFPAGFYDGLGNTAPNPNANQGFFLYHNGAPIAYTNVFNVQ